MITSFGDRDTERLYHTKRQAGRLPPNIVASALRKLDMLEAARDLRDLTSPPGNRLEALKGDLAGFHSIRINSQWRVIFVWQPGEASRVSIVDYH